MELLVKTLEAKLRAVIRELLDFPQETFLSRKLGFQLVEQLAVNIDSTAELVDAGNQTTPLVLKLPVTEDLHGLAALGRHGSDSRSDFG